MALVFPDPESATPEGLVAVGGQLTVENLLGAYQRGIFPWPHEGYPMLWFSPDPRGVLDFADLHSPRSLQKWARQHPHWRFTRNEAFDQVIKGCQSQVRPGQASTWITPTVLVAYRRFFAAGHIWSVEAWEDEELIGGIYGVRSSRYFSAESMFHRRPNASKLCLFKLVEHLEADGLRWVDVQMITPVIGALGGKYIPRRTFLDRIRDQ